MSYGPSSRLEHRPDRSLLSILALAVGLVIMAAPAARAWTPPIGIPAPPFGLTEVAPPTPSPWTTPVPGFYYVDENVAGATDSANPYGTPARPRRTIPLSLPAGAVVTLHGPYTKEHSSPNILVSTGTATSPVFIRGANATALRHWQVRGSYFIVEHLTFAAPSPSWNQDLGLDLIGPSDHGVLRYNDVSGSLTSGGVRIYGYSPTARVTASVLYQNTIHDNGDINSPLDQDVHGVHIVSFVDTFWALENTVSRNSGSGIVVDAAGLAAQPYTHHIYVGRNTVFQTRQAGIFSKQSVDTIISQNVAHDIIDTPWSPSKAFGFQYAPERLWFLFNEGYNCRFGIYAGDDSGDGETGSGLNQYAVGNLLHDIHHVPGAAYNPNTSWSEAAIMWAGGTNRYLVNNTLWNVDAGINVPGGGTVTMTNNIIGSLLQPQGNHVFLEARSTTYTLQYALFQGPLRLKLPNGFFTSLAALQAQGQGSGSLNTDPRFVAAGDYHLASTSPAIDHGVADRVYQTFLTLYGLDIAVDRDGAARLQGAAYDIGAYEYGGTTSTTAPPPPPPPSGDTTPPVVGFASKAVQGTTLTVTVSATDNVGVTRVELYFGGRLVASSTAPPYVFSGNISTLSPGTYTLQAKGYDAVGNIGSARTTFTK
jgi:hypothetical protein